MQDANCQNNVNNGVLGPEGLQGEGSELGPSRWLAK